MQHIHWILEEDIFSEGHLPHMVEAIKSMGGTYTMVKYIPFHTGAFVRSGDLEDHLHQVHVQEKGESTILYGSINLLKKAEKYTSFYPGAGVTWKHYNCAFYYPEIYPYGFNRYANWYPLDFAVKDADRIFPVSMFVRPDTPTKEFNGGSYTRDEFIEATKDLVVQKPSMPVVVAPCQHSWLWANNTLQYRLFYVDGKFVTGSRSHVKDIRDTSPEVPKEVIKFADTVLERTDFYPDPVFVMDIVGMDDNFWGSFSVMEIGPWACAGLYECDINKLVEAVHNFYKDFEWWL